MEAGRTKHITSDSLLGRRAVPRTEGDHTAVRILGPCTELSQGAMGVSLAA